MSQAYKSHPIKSEVLEIALTRIISTRIRLDRIRLISAKRDLAMTATSKVLATGKTHVTAGHNGAAHSQDGQLDIKLPQPHPAAENLFGAAWSACYMGALELAANNKHVKLPPEV